MGLVDCRLALDGFGVEDRDDVAQALAVGFHQSLELFLEFDFLLEPGIVLQRFQLLELFLKGLFGCTKFSESGQNDYSNQNIWLIPTANKAISQAP